MVLLLFITGIVAGCVYQQPEVLKPLPFSYTAGGTPSGYISQPPEVLKVNPEIDWNTQVGFNKSGNTFTIIKGSIPKVKASLREPPQQSIFSVNDSLNFIVFRRVFNEAGYGIEIDKVERRGNTFTVHIQLREKRARNAASKRHRQGV